MKFMKYTISLCLALSLLAACSNGKTNNKDENLKDDVSQEDMNEEDLMNEINEDSNSDEAISVTGNKIGDIEEQRYNVRVRIVSIHHQLINTLLSIAPNPNTEFDKYSQVSFVEDGEALLLQIDIYKTIIKDIYNTEGFDAKFTKEEEDLNNRLEKKLTALENFLNETIVMFELNDKNEYIFNTKKYRKEDYIKSFYKYKEVLDNDFIDYVYYASNLLKRDEIEDEVTKDEVKNLITYSDKFHEDVEYLIEELNLLSENKYKYGNDYSSIYNYANNVLSQKEDDMKQFNNLFDIIELISKEKDYTKLVSYNETLKKINKENYFIEDYYLIDDKIYFHNYLTYTIFDKY